MNIGNLDDRIRVEQEVPTRDPRTNEVKIAWVAAGALWADIQDVLPSQDEATIAGVDLSKRPAKVRTRYCSWLTSKMRFVDLRTNRILSLISGPAELGRKEAMDWLANTYSTEGQGG